MGFQACRVQVQATSVERKRHMLKQIILELGQLPEGPIFQQLALNLKWNLSKALKKWKFPIFR